MRVLLLAALFAIVLLAVPSTSAAPPVCDSTTVDAGVVKATVGYGGGLGCLDASAERCTLHSNPDYPSHPYWRCTRII